MHESENHLSSEPNLQLPDQEKPRIEYKILTLNNYHKRMVEEQQLMDVNYPDDDRMRAFYVMRTDQLIERAERESADTILYLDKSARPVQWMVKEFWPIFAGQKPMPESKFVNIDASEWLGKSSEEPRPDEDEVYHADIPQEAIEELRATFKDPQQPERSVFDGKKVIVVDEVSVSGGSLALAVKILQTAFPDAHFIGYSWMIPEKVKRGHGIYPKELPVWYHKTDPRGRGVGDIKPGSRVLSTPGAIREDEVTDSGEIKSRYRQDELSRQLRAEIKQLAYDVKEGVQSIVPGTREDDSYYDIDPSTGQAKLDANGRPISSKFKIRYVK